MAVLLCAALTLQDRWGSVPGAGSGSGPGGAPSTLPDLAPPAATGAAPASTQAVNGALARPDAVAVLAHVAEVGERARRAAPAAPEPVSAEALQARVASDPTAVHAHTAGQRIRVRGRLEGVEEGEAGVAVMRLSLHDRPQGLRLVASPAMLERARAWARTGAPAEEVSLDCLSQGVMMGEWLLVDCRD
jgi:hypothetical protein